MHSAIRNAAAVSAMTMLIVGPCVFGSPDDASGKVAEKGAVKAESVDSQTKSPSIKPISPPPKPSRNGVPRAAAANTGEAKAVLDELIAAEVEQQATNRRNAAALVERSRALEKDEKLADALRLARQAKAIDPNLVEAVDLVQRLQSAQTRKLSANVPIVRARAHLAAALSRAGDLHVERRYAMQEDLLRGIVRACELFRDPATVDRLKKSALDQLARLEMIRRNDSGSPEFSGSTPAQADSLRLGYGVPAPENFRRLIRGNDFETPGWYRSQKAALGKPLNVDYRHASVALVFDDLAERAGVRLVVDEPVTQSRAHLNAAIDLRASDVPAESLLSLACAKAGLEYVILEKSIVVTTPAKAIRYARELPEVVRDHWAYSRMLFPNLDAAMLASQPAPPGMAIEGLNRGELESLPDYLRSGDALVAHIRTLVQ